MPPRTPAPTQLMTVPPPPVGDWDDGEDWSAICAAQTHLPLSDPNPSGLEESDSDYEIAPSEKASSPDPMSDSDTSRDHNIYLCDDTDED